MQKVYESSTALEAHMIKNLLGSVDISSRIDGEDLQGGVGTLQAIGIVRVLVDDADFKNAREIIDSWESDQPAVKEGDSKLKSKSGTAKSFIFGVLITAGFAYWLLSSPVTTDGIDYNGDGLLDEKWIFKNNLISKATHDRNLDGTVDLIYNYSFSGIVKSAELDNDFDGAFETKLYFRKGNVTLEEMDETQNGVVERRTHYKFGQLDSIDFIDEETGKIRKKQFFEIGKLVSADYDSNGDGNLDIHYEYDNLEEIE
jgi:antitoxin component YwqK of YwqJK toxin-antitoxin module